MTIEKLSCKRNQCINDMWNKQHTFSCLIGHLMRSCVPRDSFFCNTVLIIFCFPANSIFKHSVSTLEYSLKVKWILECGKPVLVPALRYCERRVWKTSLLPLWRPGHSSSLHLPFPHTRMFPLESPVIVSPFSENVTHKTNLGFSCFCNKYKHHLYLQKRIFFCHSARCLIYEFYYLGAQL